MALISLQILAIPVIVKFRLMDENENPIKGATVHIYDKNRLVATIENSSAKIKWKLESDSYYTIEVLKDNFVSKKVGIYTYVENDVEEILDNHFIFFIELERNSKYSKFKNSDAVTDYPSAIVEFDRTEGVFDYNQKYWISTRLHYKRLFDSLVIPEF